MRKLHKRNHGLYAVYITLPSGGHIQFESWKEMPLDDIVTSLRNTADQIETARAASASGIVHHAIDVAAENGILG